MKRSRGGAGHEPGALELGERVRRGVLGHAGERGHVPDRRRRAPRAPPARAPPGRRHSAGARGAAAPRRAPCPGPARPRARRSPRSARCPPRAPRSRAARAGTGCRRWRDGSLRRTPVPRCCRAAPRRADRRPPATAGPAGSRPSRGRRGPRRAARRAVQRRRCAPPASSTIGRSAIRRLRKRSADIDASSAHWASSTVIRSGRSRARLAVSQ